MADEERSVRDELLASFEKLSTDAGHDTKSEDSLPLYTQERPDAKTDTTTVTVDRSGEEGQAKGESQPDPADKDGRARDDAGKFVAKADGAKQGDEAGKIPGEAAKASETPEQIAANAAAAAAAAAADPPPRTWKPEIAAEWSKLPPTVRDHVRTMEQHAIDAIKSLSEPIAPIRAMAERRGIPWQQGLQQLATAQQRLDQDPQAALIWLAQAYKVDLDQLADIAAAGGKPAANGQPNGNAAAYEALTPVVGRLEAIERRLQADAAEREKTSSDSALAEIEAFARDNPHYLEVEKHIPALIPWAKSQKPRGSAREILQAAYDAAIRVNPDIAAKVEASSAAAIAKKKTDDAAAHAAKAKKASEVDHRGGPGRTSPANGDANDNKPLRSQLEANWNAVFSQ